MKFLYEKIKEESYQSKKFLSRFLVLYLIVRAFSAFPMLSDTDPAKIGGLLLGSFLAGAFLYAVITCSTIQIFVILILTNTIGFGLRVWLEWGEYSMMRDLSFITVLLTYVPIILFGFIGYYCMKRCATNTN